MFSDKSLSKKETAFSSLGIFSIEMSQLSQSRRNDKEWWMQMSDLQTGRGTLNIISQFWIADSHRRKRMCWRSGNTDLLRYWRWAVFFFFLPWVIIVNYHCHIVRSCFLDLSFQNIILKGNLRHAEEIYRHCRSPPAFPIPDSAWFLLKAVHMLRMMSKNMETQIATTADWSLFRNRALLQGGGKKKKKTS